MDVFNNILLAVHFLGLAMGMGSGMALGALAPGLMSTAGDEKSRNWSTYHAISRTAHVGLGTLIVTGLVLVFTRYNGPAEMSVAFWIKMALVVVLIASITIGTRAAKRLEAGDAAAGPIGKRAGMVNGLTGLGIILAAVFAFN